MNDARRHFPPVEEQLERIERGVVDLVSRDELVERLEASRASGRPLRVKLGIDPSSPDIHVGHTVVLRKLRTFQDLGHQAVLIWGTATAMVGDPTGRDKTRPQLTREEVLKNLETYKRQIGLVVDVEAAEHRENGEWFDEMRFPDVIRLLSNMTVARAIERDSFAQRMQKGLPISLHEVVYPLMQGYDSVMIEADVELGGTDQLFNLLVGRDLLERAGRKPQVCITLPILEGLDGSRKMSKSYGNYIGLFDPPAEMYGKVMSIPDELMEKYFTLLTEVPADEVRRLLAGHPREAKARLAFEITAEYHDEAAARAAAEEFDRVFRRHDLPSDVPEYEVPAAALRDGRISVAVAAHLAGLAGSGGEVRRAIKGGGVKVDGERIGDPRAVLDPGRHLVQVGKRRFAWIVVPGA